MTSGMPTKRLGYSHRISEYFQSFMDTHTGIANCWTLEVVASRNSAKKLAVPSSPSTSTFGVLCGWMCQQGDEDDTLRRFGVVSSPLRCSCYSASLRKKIAPFRGWGGGLLHGSALHSPALTARSMASSASPVGPGTNANRADYTHPLKKNTLNRVAPSLDCRRTGGLPQL
jgi:hypothetical protein